MMAEAQSKSPGPSAQELMLKLVGPGLAVATFAWGIYTYQTTTNLQIQKAEEESKRLARTHNLEAAKPFLDRQLGLFTKAIQATSIIATSNDAAEVQAQLRIFYQLYYGELAMVERGGVAGAMIAFKNALDQKKPQAELQGLSLNLAHKFRDELGKAWDTTAWSM